MVKAFSIFLFIQDNQIVEIGYTCYPIDMDEISLCRLMQDNVNNNFMISRRVKLRSPISLDDYNASCRLGVHFKYFEPIFEKENASINPLVLITNIVDGQPRIDLITDHQPFIYTEDVQKVVHQDGGYIPDYLEKYMKDEGFDMSSLIHDDFYVPMKLLFNNQLYISCAKLLLSCIDTIGFIEFGNSRDVFVKWLNTYADLAPHNVTAEELWELRNSLLHMSNLDSHKVLQGKHPRIMLYVGSQSERERKMDGCKSLNLHTFVASTMPQALSKWMQSYNDMPSKMKGFIKRYDTILSDVRMARIELKPE